MCPKAAATLDRTKCLPTHNMGDILKKDWRQ